MSLGVMSSGYCFRRFLVMISRVVIPCFVVALGLVLVGSGSSRAVAQETGLFGSREVRSTQLSAFKKWNSMVERHTEETRPGARRKGPCRVTANFRCPVDEWKDVIAALKGQDFATQLDEVNRYMNRAPYITDIVNWGVKDYWATLRQFFTKDGDCEDYAIAKYYSLKELGIPPENMRIAVVQDTNLDVAHAVLVVYGGKTAWVLDNQIPYVVRAQAVVHYRPFYSINETAWWLHKM